MDAKAEGMQALYESTATHVLGIDEVGLGPIAGPLVVGGVVAPRNWKHDKVKDSKKFNNTKKKTAHDQRCAVLWEVIQPQVSCYHYESVSSEDVDALGIDAALYDAMRRVYMVCTTHYPDALPVFDGTLNGNEHKDVYVGALAFPKADALVPAVSAASILAKVVRDDYMIRADASYPGYNFKQHMGYPTKEHKAALQRLGICDEHRRTYKTIASTLRGR